MTVIFAVLALIISRNWKFCFESSTVLCIIFLLCALISLINVPHSLLGTAGNGIRKLFITCMFILAVGTFINTERKLWNVIACLAMACFVSSLDGIFQYVSGFSFLNHEALFSNTDELQFAKSDMLLNIFRARSNLGHPDALGGFLICYVFTFMSFGFFYFKDYKKFIFRFLSALCLFAIFFTFSRGVAFAMILATLLFVTLKRNIILILFGLVTISFMFFLLPRGVKTWITNAESLAQMYAGTETKNSKYAANSRFDIWRTALNMTYHNPLTGVGLNTFGHHYSTYKPKTDPMKEWGAHTTYLAISAEIGIFGLIAVIVGFLSLYIACLKTLKHPASLEYKIISIGLISGFTALALFNIYSGAIYLGSWRVGPMLALLLGMIIAMYRLNFSSQHQTQFNL